MDGLCEECSATAGSRTFDLTISSPARERGTGVENYSVKEASVFPNTEATEENAVVEEAQQAANPSTRNDKRAPRRSNVAGTPCPSEPVEEMQKPEESWVKIPRSPSPESFVEVEEDPDWDIINKDELKNEGLEIKRLTKDDRQCKIS